ncbi:MAG TPA: tetratricopeptide repeat protein [Thermoanaerobaculia bacterium]|nr:tetratricopeptide repeat protein [Thermoanaerobaculia bacterium]
MPEINPKVPPPFDQGIFLLHYNHGREAFQEGRYGEARRELETAQKMRPDDTDVLNLLGLVYFKTGAYPEAEFIYRRLVEENPSVFILHSNLGLTCFRQKKLGDAERHLRKAIELRPNYSKSHLYLGLLYRMKGKLGLALEHLKFAGAEKAAKEVEREMTGGTRPAGGRESSKGEEGKEPVSAAPEPRQDPGDASARNAARKLQEAVDETPLGEELKIEAGGRPDGPARAFHLHENGFLEINFEKSVWIRKGTISSYSGNLRFSVEEDLQGTTAAGLVRAEGGGKMFLFEKGHKTIVLNLADEFIFVEGSNLMAVEETLSYRLEPMYEPGYQSKIDVIKIFGRGSVAVSTSVEPLTMRVTRELPLSISSRSLVAWSGDLIPSVTEDDEVKGLMIEGAEPGFRIRFEGEGVVVSEQ